MGIDKDNSNRSIVNYALDRCGFEVGLTPSNVPVELDNVISKENCCLIFKTLDTNDNLHKTN